MQILPSVDTRCSFLTQIAWSSSFDEWFFDESFDLAQFLGICFQTPDTEHTQQKQPLDFLSPIGKPSAMPFMSPTKTRLCLWLELAELISGLQTYSNETAVAGFLMKLMK